MLTPEDRAALNQVPMISDFNRLLHELRTCELRLLPKGVSTFVSAGCSGRWYFDWVEESCGPIREHIGIELYSPKPADLPENARWVASSVDDLSSLPNSTADILFSGQNIEHLWPADILGFLQEARRVLRPDGLLVLDSPNRLVTSKLKWCHPEHVIEFTPDEIADVLTLAGFEDIRVKGVWLCQDPQTEQVFPLGADGSDQRWGTISRMVCAADQPDQSFCWWATAKPSSAPPVAKALDLRLDAVCQTAWVDRLSRLSCQIGQSMIMEGIECQCSKPGESGFLLFGPYVPLREGDYEVDLWLSTPQPPESPEIMIARLDVTAEPGTVILHSQEIYPLDLPAGRVKQFSLRIRANSYLRGVQFRVFASGACELAVARRIGLRRQEER